MLSDHDASDLHFEGLGAQAATAAAAASELAATLQRWTADHRGVRIEQLSVAPYAADGVLALVAYTEDVLPSDAQEAVAAAVEEIHEAQHNDTPLVAEEPPSAG